MMERAGWEPSDDHHPHHHHICPNCPRCGCSNTKFCYYNNYSLTQPRYFCKGCRRYWTKGGSLRNVPVGGGCRKNRRGSFKSLRLPTTTATDGHVHRSNVPNSYGTIAIMNNSVGDPKTTSSSVTQDGPSNIIDLALVYANFLNQKPESSNSAGSDHQLPELPSEFDTVNLDFSSMALNRNNASSGLMEDHHQHQNGLVGSLGGGCHTSTSTSTLPHHDLSTENCSANIDHMYFGGLDPLVHHIQDEIDFGLPPLPGQEALWSSSNSQMMVSSSSSTSTHVMQVVAPLFGPEDHDPNLLIGSWSPFDLPCNETFSRST